MNTVPNFSAYARFENKGRISVFWAVLTIIIFYIFDLLTFPRLFFPSQKSWGKQAYSDFCEARRIQLLLQDTSHYRTFYAPGAPMCLYAKKKRGLHKKG